MHGIIVSKSIAISISAAVIFYFGSPIPSLAQIFTKDGYEVDVHHKYNKKNEKVKAWATIKGGEACNHLQTNLLLTDGKQIVQLKSVIDDYKPTDKGYELEPQAEKVSKSKKADWRPYQVEIQCL